MSERISGIIEKNKHEIFRFLNKVICAEKKLNVKGNLLEILANFKKENEENDYSSIEEILNHATESVCLGNSVYFEIRDKIGISDYYHFSLEDQFYEPINADDYLKAKEEFAYSGSSDDQLQLNFKTFYDKFPSVRDHKSIGRGVEYLNRYLSSKMFTEPEKLRKALFDFLFVHKYKSQQLILNDRINSPEELSLSIEKAVKFLKKKNEEAPFKEVKHKLQELGFEPGLGNNAGKILENLDHLERLLQSPDYQSLKEFLNQIPMVFNIAVITPHGYFGQEGVLGMPDTGGQVVYILDQVKALERAMKTSLSECGIDADPKILILTRLIPNAGKTNSNQRLEKVHETSNVFILRVPFRSFNENVTNNWISRFEIWPYLETFADDSYRELLAEFGERPDFIIGNYSDGNMVAYMLARKFGVTQCNIAHALEKSKYLYSDIYWKNMEDNYHFSIQFTADLIAMNTANFIVTSSYQEIAGTEESIGQYESYLNFTMPDLYRVTGGINLFHPKFNIVPPGVNTNIYFPYTNEKGRLRETKKELGELIFENVEDPEVFGTLENPDKIPIFSLARLDRIKNLTSLAEWFGKSEELQEKANLIMVAGKINPDHATDVEEKEQIQLMHDIIEKYNIRNKIRWMGKLFRKDQTGEVYRLIADRKGVFVQPALFEGFGLTVLEAMRSGLPVFATFYGGPLEIIEDSSSGFHIDPIDGEASTKKILDFLAEAEKDEKVWKRISQNAIKRVDSAYNWDLYANNLLSLAKIYGFWKYTTNIEMEELNAYLDVLYHLLYKPRANQILEIHSKK